MSTPKTPVLIAVPMRRFRPDHAADDLPEHLKMMYAFLVASTSLPWSFEMMTFGGGNVARGRNKITAQFMRGTWKWIAMVDDDIVPDVDGDAAAQGKALAEALVRILSHRKAICGGLYTTKEEEHPHWVLNPWREAEIGDDGLLLVPELGTGGMKTFHRSVFEKVIQCEPDLAYRCEQSGAPEWGFFCQGMMTVRGVRRWLPEDYWFDQVCAKHGFVTYVDTKVRFRHLNTADGRTYPLEDEWPPLPGPTKPIPPPPCAEDYPTSTAACRMVVCLQYWEGDRIAAQRLARFIADLEPATRYDVEICLVRRHDASAMDKEVIEHLARKFAVTERVTPEHVVGYPQSPNAMAFDVMTAAAEWEDVDVVMLMESDCVPVARDWLNQLKAEWLRAAGQDKLVLGSWRAECTPDGHINGNMLFAPSLVRTAGVNACPPKKAWDVHFVRYFEPHWMRTGLIANRYCQMYLTDEQILTPECGTRPPAVIHGVKDGSVWAYVKKIGLPA